MKNSRKQTKVSAVRSGLLTALFLMMMSGAAFAGTVTLQFRTSTGAGISGVTPQYLVGSTWTDFAGSTDGSGIVTQSFGADATRQFRISYGSGTLALGSFNTATDPTINAYTTLVTVNLKHYDGSLITAENGIVDYNNGSWLSFGTTSGGIVSKELLPSSYYFRMAFHDYTQQVNPIAITGGTSPGNTQSIDFQTTLVTTSLMDHTGATGLSGGVAQYYVGGWHNIPGTTDGTGTNVQMELLPGSYIFNMTYNHFTQQTASINVTNNSATWQQTVSFRTTLVTTSLADHTGAGLSGGTPQYHTNIWYTIPGGPTDGSGTNVTIELLQGSYSFNMNYNNFTQQPAAVSITDNGGTWQQTVSFRTTLVTASLMDHTGAAGLSGGTPGYYSGGWYTIPGGPTDGSGTNVKIELLQGSYSFNMNYSNNTQQPAPISITDNGSTWLQTVPFQTTLVSLNIRNCSGTLITSSPGAAQYYGAGWLSYGTTTGGFISKELIPANYYFNMNYRGVTPQVGPLPVSGTTQDINFTTTNVTIPGATSSSYSNTSGGTYTSFSPSSGIDLFPGTYFFKINGASTGVSKTISGCTPSFVIAPCTAPSIGVTGDCFSKTLTAPSGNTYVWNPGAATTQSVNVTTAGTRSVTVTYDFGCTGTASPSIVYTTSVTMPSPFAIAASTGANGSISPTGTVNVCPGGAQVYAMTPAGGYHVSDILVDGSSVGAVSTYTFSAVGAAHTISASFAPDCTAPSITSDATATDATCNGGTDGSATTYTDGSPTLTYSWSNGATTSAISGVAAGTYTYTVTNGCGSATGSVTISQPDVLAASSSVTSAVACNGGNATVSVSATGGTAPYGSFSGTQYGDHTITAGSYSYTVYDANGCSASASGTVSEPDVLAASSSVTSAVACNGGNATVSVSATGGTTPYNTFDGTEYGDHTVTAGTYTYTVYDANGCSNATSITVSEPDVLAASSSVTGAVACNGGNATVNVSATGGTAPYNTFDGTEYGDHTVTAGAYTYTVYDANGCSNATSITVSQPDVLAASSSVTSAVACNGGNATVSVSATGGTAPYNTFSGTQYGDHTVSAGTYTYTVYDINGCSNATSITVSEPDALAASSSVTSAVACNGGNATVSVSATGGTAPYNTFSGTQYGDHTVTAGAYTYTVYDANGCSNATSITVSEPDVLAASSSVTGAVACNGGNATVNVSATGGTAPYNTFDGTEYGDHTVTAGTYTYTVYDINGCSASTSVTVSEPDVLVASSTHTDVLCNGGNTGAVTISATGGAIDYTGIGLMSGLSVGAYTYTVTDNNGCTATTSGTISEPDVLAASSSVTSAVACNGGNATVSVSATGGTAPYNTFSGTQYGDHTVSAGTYTYTVYDINGCSNATSITVSEPDALAASSSVTSAVACNGGNATVSVSATGGTAPYNTFSGTQYGDHTVTAGTYTYTVYDANGCSNATSITVSEPDALAASSSVTSAVACNGGNATVSVSATGGTAPYDTYSGTQYGDHTITAGSYSYTVYDANGCSASASGTVSEPDVLAASSSVTSAVACNGGNATVSVSATGGTAPYNTFSGTQYGDHTVSAGTYTYTVYDANGCSNATSITVSQPDVLAASSSVTSAVACNGGNATVSVSATGGTAPYNTFSGTQYGDHTVTAGAYTYTVYDINGCSNATSITVSEPDALAASSSVTSAVACNGGNATVSVSATGGTTPYNTFDGTEYGDHTVTAGTYTYTVYDANGCSASTSVTVSEPDVLVASSSVTSAVACNGGNATVSVSATGGTTPYNTFDGTEYGDHTVTAGTYTYTVYDANGCSNATSITVSEPDVLTASSTHTNVLCNGGNTGTVTVSATGGTIDYTGIGLMTGLSAGPYSYTVTDNNGCTATTTGGISEPHALAFSAYIDNVNCNGGYDGFIDADASGGTPSYSYSWSTGGAGFTWYSDFFGPAGTYTVTVRDAHGCTLTAPFTVTEPTALVLTATTANVSCHGGNNGSINTTVSGGSGSYNYYWSNGSHTADLAGLSAGTYGVLVTDAHTCIRAASYTITQPAGIVISGAVSNVICNGGTTGSITSSVTGGVAPYHYLWAPGGATTSGLSGQTAGTYTLTVTDDNGCTAAHTYTITEPTHIAASVTVTGVSCYGGSNGAINLTVSGGTPGYTYLWSTGATGANPTGLHAGTYDVTFRDANGCTAFGSFPVLQPASALSVTVTGANVTCNGGNNGSVSASATGGTPDYTYTWSPGGGITSSLTGMVAGAYSVTVTDAHGCTATGDYTITQPAAFSVNGTVTNVSCNGGNNGGIATSVTGGTSAYSYVWSCGGSASGISGKTAGTYSVTVTDARGCSARGAYTITQPAVLSVSGAVTNVSCHGGNNGSIAASVTGGTSAFSYVWSCGGSASGISGKTAGTYSVTVTDAHGCTARGAYTITQPATAVSAAIVSSANVTCNGGNNGSITATSAGGTGTRNYSWSPSGGSAAIATGLIARSYTVTVTDANGCSARASATITQPSAMTVSISYTPGSSLYCGATANTIYLGYGPQTATLTATATGGSGYTYSWSSASGTGNLSNAHVRNPVFTATLPGHYTYLVTVTSNTGCTATASVSICVIDAVDHHHSGYVLLCHAAGCSPTTLSLLPSGVPAHITGHSATDHLGPVGSSCAAGRGAEQEQPVVEAVNELTVTAFPNPYSNEVHLKITTNLTDNVDVIVYDITGRVRESKLNQEVGSDLSFGQNFTPGVYFIEVKQGDQSRKVKVVKY